ncbi:hypothetical protein N8683_01175 [bacterium]|nr:hypothetical protein [bacterium]
MSRKPTYKPSANGKNEKGEQYWRVKKGLKVNGQPDWQPFGTDYNKALAFCEALKLRDQTGGALELEWIQQQSFNDIKWSFSKLAEIGVPLKTAVESFVSQNYPEGGSITVGKAVLKLLKDKKDNIEATTYQRYETFLDKFASYFNERFLHSITTTEVEQFFNDVGVHWSRNTAGPNKKLLRGFFNEWKRQGYLSKETDHAMERITIDRKKKSERRKPKLATPQDAAQMLNWHCSEAAKRENSKKGAEVAQSIYGVVFQLVLVLFGGVRRAEAACLSWDDVYFKQGLVVVPEEIAKNGLTRQIPLEGNLKSWMQFLKNKKAECAVEDGVDGRSVKPAALKRLSYRQSIYRKSFVDRGAPVPEIIKTTDKEVFEGADSSMAVNQNIMRRSFVNYHYALHQSAEKTAEVAGHSIAVSFKSYKEYVHDPEKAKNWFAIQPPEIITANKEFDHGIASVKEAAELEKEMEFLRTLEQTKERNDQIWSLTKRLHKWTSERRDNVHDLAKYREWHDDDGKVDHWSEDGEIISKSF